MDVDGSILAGWQSCQPFGYPVLLPWACSGLTLSGASCLGLPRGLERRRRVKEGKALTPFCKRQERKRHYCPIENFLARYGDVAG